MAESFSAEPKVRLGQDEHFFYAEAHPPFEGGDRLSSPTSSIAPICCAPIEGVGSQGFKFDREDFGIGSGLQEAAFVLHMQLVQKEIGGFTLETELNPVESDTKSLFVADRHVQTA